MQNILYVLFFTLAFAGLFRGALVGEDVAVDAMETRGFSEVTVERKAWFLVGLRGCSEKDAVRFDVSAINPAGDRVRLSVCSGWILKGATVRS